MREFYYDQKNTGILWMLMSVIGFTAMSLFIKYMPHISMYEKLFRNPDKRFLCLLFLS